MNEYQGGDLRPTRIVKRFAIVAVCLLVAACFSDSSAAAQPTPAVDTTTLERTLTARGFTPPEEFKAYVMRLGADGAPTHRYDWRGSSTDRDDWWPASSIKIYAAVAALQALHQRGFSIRTYATYHYPTGEDGPEDVTRRFDQIVRHAIAQSNNRAFNMLVELVGLDELNTGFFVADNGFEDTVFLRHYFGRNPDPDTDVSSARPSPRISLRRGRHRQVIDARNARGQYACPEDGNCTTLRELAEVMRRVMAHEQIPQSQRYALEAEDLTVLRDAMSHARNYAIGEVVERACPGVEVWHKPGFALRWVSNVMYVENRETGLRYVTAMTGRPDRRSLDSAAEHIARAFCEGALPAGG